jgi:hypothetical protein
VFQITSVLLGASAQSASVFLLSANIALAVAKVTDITCVLGLLAIGTSDGEIARKMALAPDQLQQALSGLCAQFNVADRLELILLI